MALVLDTSVLLAALDPNDSDHRSASSLLEDHRELFIVPVSVLVELDYLIGRRGKTDVWGAFAEDLAAGAYELHPLSPDLVLRAARLQKQYGDLRLGFVDASVFLTCVDLGEPKVATLDRRHFSVLRLPNGSLLEILPS
jgi:predicted nucleic acid-binding protein